MRGRRTESRKTSSMSRNRMIGSAGSTSRTAFAIGGCSAAAGNVVRSTRCMLASPKPLPSRPPWTAGKMRGIWSSST